MAVHAGAHAAQDSGGKDEGEGSGVSKSIEVTDSIRLADCDTIRCVSNWKFVDTIHEVEGFGVALKMCVRVHLGDAPTVEYKICGRAENTTGLNVHYADFSEALTAYHRLISELQKIEASEWKNPCAT
jgi:hypothetical protein